MRKTPSYLKGLAETRARVAGDVIRYQKILVEVTRALADSQIELASCDRLIRKFDNRLNPELINPIHAWKGRYGKRGQLLTAIVRLLKEHAPSEMTTLELGWMLQVEFQLDFPSAQEKYKWQANSLRNALKKLVANDQVERLHDLSEGFTSEVGRWRWKSDDVLSLDHLRARAEAAGVSVQQADDDHE
jgi:hypothetical protein